MIYNEHICDGMSLWTDLCHYCFSFGCQDRCLHSLQCRPWNWLGSSLANLIGNEFWLLSLIFKLATWVSKGILPIRYFHSNFILCKLIVYFSFPLSYFNIILAGLVPLSDPSFLHLSGKNIKQVCQIGIYKLTFGIIEFILVYPLTIIFFSPSFFIRGMFPCAQIWVVKTSNRHVK